MTLATLEAVHEASELDIARKLLPLHQASSVELQKLINHFSDPSMKKFFIYIRATQLRCADELEEKIRQNGMPVGDLPGNATPSEMEDVHDIVQDPILRDRALLLSAINGLLQILQAYLEFRRETIPFGLRMILQRHQLQVCDAMERLSALYLSYPTHTLRSHGLECAA